VAPRRKGAAASNAPPPPSPRRSCVWYAPGGGCGRCVPCRAVMRAEAVGDAPPADALCAAADGILTVDVGEGFCLALDRHAWRRHALVTSHPPQEVELYAMPQRSAPHAADPVRLLLGDLDRGSTRTPSRGVEACAGAPRVVPAHVATVWMQQWRWSRACALLLTGRLREEAQALHAQMEVR
jgi:hypothetical protein